MPFRSEKQRRYIYKKAAEGAKWAKRFIEHSGGKPPKKSKKKKAKRGRK